MIIPLCKYLISVLDPFKTTTHPDLSEYEHLLRLLSLNKNMKSDAAGAHGHETSRDVISGLRMRHQFPLEDPAKNKGHGQQRGGGGSAVSHERFDFLMGHQPEKEDGDNMVSGAVGDWFSTHGGLWTTVASVIADATRSLDITPNKASP